MSTHYKSVTLGEKKMKLLIILMPAFLPAALIIIKIMGL